MGVISNKKWWAVITLIFSVLLVLAVGSPGNLEYVKEQAPEVLGELNYEIIGYEGYQWGFWGYNSYGGANVWYLLRSKSDNGIIYQGCLKRWGDEVHLYNLKAVDAIKP